MIEAHVVSIESLKNAKEDITKTQNWQNVKCILVGDRSNTFSDFLGQQYMFFLLWKDSKHTENITKMTHFSLVMATSTDQHNQLRWPIYVINTSRVVFMVTS